MIPPRDHRVRTSGRLLARGAAAVAIALGLAKAASATGAAEVSHYRLEGPAPWREVRAVEGAGYRIALSSPDGVHLEARVEVRGGVLRDAPFPPRAESLPDEARAALTHPEDPEADALAKVLTRGTSTVLAAIERVVAFTSRRIRYELPTGDAESAASCRRALRGSCVGRSLLAADLLVRSGIPARQISGVLTAVSAEELTPESRPAFSPELGGVRHRWLEAYVPGLGWVPSDPGGLANTVTSRHLALTRIAEPTLTVITLGRSPELRWPAVAAPWRGLTLGRPREAAAVLGTR